MSGHFEGVGMNVEQDRRGLKVLRVFDGSPAKDAPASSAATSSSP